jgi:hypothetical protein
MKTEVKVALIGGLAAIIAAIIAGIFGMHKEIPKSIHSQTLPASTPSQKFNLPENAPNSIHTGNIRAGHDIKIIQKIENEK